PGSRSSQTIPGSRTGRYALVGRPTPGSARGPRRAAAPRSGLVSRQAGLGRRPRKRIEGVITSMSIDDTAQRLLYELDDIRRLVGARAEEPDGRSALADDVVRALVQHRLSRLWIPRRYEGLELGLPDALEIYQAAARIDGSFGWAVMIGAGGGLFAAYLDEPSARAVFGPSDAVIAGSGAPDGRAERVPGGYRVQGRWRYASGAPYATTFTANCIVTRGGAPVRGDAGEPLVRAMAFPRDAVEIVETWDAAGMRATSSHDFR